MRINKLYLSLIIYLFVVGSLNAQDKGNTKLNRDSLLNSITNIDKRLKGVSVRDTSAGFSAPIKIDTAYANRIDFNFTPQRNKKGLLVVDNNWTPFSDNVTFRDTVVFDPAFLPVIFDGNIIPANIDFMPKKALDTANEFHLIPPESTFKPQLDRIQRVQDMRRYYYTNNPGRVNMNVFNFADPEILRETAVVEKKNIFKELVTADDAVSITKPEVEKIQIKPVYWIKTGEHSLQINQNSFSKNWSGGGTNNFSVLSYHKITLNYKKNKLSFNNTIEWRLNLQQNSADTLRKINTTDDFLRTYSVLGISAFIKKWSYTATLEVKTPLFSGFPINSDTKTRAIFSPLLVNAGIGMGYTLENTSKSDKYKKTKLTLDLAPLSVNYTYVGDEGVDETKFGIDENKKSRLDFGSTINANLTINFNRFSGFSSRWKYFTNYEKALVESENKFTMSFNRFLSTSIYYYLKFDDGVGISNKSKGWGYFQYNQVIGFGLTYTW